ncbi:MAG: peptidylprolyl isomerase [Gammaproteobacteria bacterium]|nr:peptidylprolyl isomerase [Gammaproteobacteria bacterium]MDH5777209.1 peptidylprolyl isomerase [Gammaproteobacteria bacterium]
MTELLVEKSKVVTFVYTIFDENGSVQEQSDIPMSYIHGIDGKMFEKVEAEMEGKKIGDVIEVTLEPADAFGERDPSLTYTDSLENVPPEFQQLGAEAMFENDLGEQVAMVVTEIKDGQITLDGNHPYAGRQMTFKITIQDIREATTDEMGKGEVADSQDPPVIH